MRYYGDYLGFRFGDYHSRDLGLYRVSNGDRYDDFSIPDFSDTTAPKPGGDGTYYWDSFYTQRTFTINAAFDDLSEAQLRQIRQVFNGKDSNWLIFDEVPYKKYKVKLQNPPQIRYLTFREEPEIYNDTRVFNKLRVYKGEITFQFISYYPYAIDNFKTYDYIPEFENEIEDTYPNIDEWASSVFLLNKAQKTFLDSANYLDTSEAAAYYMYNPGDLPTDVKITINRNVLPSNLQIKLMHRLQMKDKSASSAVGDTVIGELNFKNLAISSGDNRIVIDTATNLVYGINAVGNQTGTLYNQFISSGEFFKIPVTQPIDESKSKELVDYCDYILINIPRAISGSPNCTFDYNYLYY